MGEALQGRGRGVTNKVLVVGVVGVTPRRESDKWGRLLSMHCRGQSRSLFAVGTMREQEAVAIGAANQEILFFVGVIIKG